MKVKLFIFISSTLIINSVFAKAYYQSVSITVNNSPINPVYAAYADVGGNGIGRQSEYAYVTPGNGYSVSPSYTTSDDVIRVDFCILHDSSEHAGNYCIDPFFQHPRLNMDLSCLNMGFYYTKNTIGQYFYNSISALGNNTASFQVNFTYNAGTNTIFCKF